MRWENNPFLRTAAIRICKFHSNYASDIKWYQKHFRFLICVHKCRACHSIVAGMHWIFHRYDCAKKLIGQTKTRDQSASMHYRTGGKLSHACVNTMAHTILLTVSQSLLYLYILYGCLSMCQIQEHNWWQCTDQEDYVEPSMIETELQLAQHFRDDHSVQQLDMVYNLNNFIKVILKSWTNCDELSKADKHTNENPSATGTHRYSIGMFIRISKTHDTKYIPCVQENECCCFRKENIWKFLQILQKSNAYHNLSQQ